jgi:4-hydroxythreonine-4-phosphate dehydrogenase
MGAVDIAVIADDLSGATESAAAGLLRVSRNTVVLTGATSEPADYSDDGPDSTDDAPRMTTVDTHTRQLDARAAAEELHRAARLTRDARLVVKKVDSLLRGNVGPEVAALSRALGRTPVIAPSLPRLDRLVRGGVLRVDGVPLHQTRYWHLEPRSAPQSVAETLAPLPTTEVAQTVVDAGVAQVVRALRAAEAEGLVPVCDAADDASLAVIALAARQVWERPLLVGSASMVGAALAALDEEPCSALSEHPHPGSERADRPQLGGAARALVVVGTRAHSIASQLNRLAAHAAYQLIVDPDELLKAPDRVRRHLNGLPSRGLSVVALDPTAHVEASRSTPLVRALAEVVAPHLPTFPAVVATGGETARALLDAVGVARLEVLAEIEPGAVATRTPHGQIFVTRPGSFGGPDSLLHITRRLLDSGATHEENP